MENRIKLSCSIPLVSTNIDIQKIIAIEIFFNIPNENDLKGVNTYYLFERTKGNMLKDASEELEKIYYIILENDYIYCSHLEIRLYFSWESHLGISFNGKYIVGKSSVISIDEYSAERFMKFLKKYVEDDSYK